jgi:two-component system, OmpR family, alkaline phosphatase synthesis response regulator PhoP
LPQAVTRARLLWPPAQRCKESVVTGDLDHRTSPSRPVVLVCEDDESLRELLRLSLSSDFEVLEATDGNESVELARSERPDAVIVDLMLPGVLGIDVIRTVRGEAGTGGTRIVALSAWSHLDREAVEAGADRFLSKPFDPDELRAVLAELLEVA